MRDHRRRRPMRRSLRRFWRCWAAAASGCGLPWRWPRIGFFAEPASDKAIAVAAAVETLHNATLVHDDLIDNALVRRGITTLNAVWNKGATVLAGDYLFARAAGFAGGDRKRAGGPAFRRDAAHHRRGRAAPAFLQPAVAPAEGRLLSRASSPRPRRFSPRPPARARSWAARRPSRSRRCTTTAITWAWPSRSLTTSWISRVKRRRWASRWAATCGKAS